MPRWSLFAWRVNASQALESGCSQDAGGILAPVFAGFPAIGRQLAKPWYRFDPSVTPYSSRSA